MSAEVSLTLGDETFVLKCTVEAFRNIPAALGGFVGAFQHIANADVDTCILIIAVATGNARNAKEHDRIANLLFKQGLDRSVFDKMAEYVLLLQNGGRQEAPSGTAGE